MAEANEKRDCRIFEKFAYEMSVEVQQTCISDSDFNLSIKENIYAFDSIIIDLYLNFFWWVSLKKQKNCIKLHTQFDIKTAIPVFIYIISASEPKPEQHIMGPMRARSAPNLTLRFVIDIFRSDP